MLKTIFIVIGIFLLLVLIVILISFLNHKKHLRKMKNDVKNIIIKKFSDDKAKFIEVKNKNYDFSLYLEHAIYYFKLVYQSQGKELRVLDKDNISLVYQNTHFFTKKLQDVSSFANEDLSVPELKVVKYVIFYPKVLQMIYNKNEIECQFIYSNEEICGLHFINYLELKESD